MENESITERRLAFIAYLFEEHKLDALIISRLTHIRYLTGFTGSNALLLATNRSLYFITDNRYTVQASEEVKDWKIIIARRGLYEEIKRRKYLSRAKRIGFQSKYTTHEEYQKLGNLLTRKRWIPLAVTIEPMMLQKDPYEIDAIQKSIALSELVFGSVLGMIKPGVEEREIAAEISYQHRMGGADGDAFEIIVASGPRAALPHGRPTGRPIRKNEFIIIDFGCIVDGYHSDMTRTVAVGTPEPEALKCYEVVRDALLRATERVREGIACKKVDSIARSYIGKHGYDNYFGHSLGHGIGLDIHELPSISPYSTERFVARSTITIEPGIYIPERFGVRIEDDVLVTENGCERLTTLSHELITV
jgi:Xaa-Pro aminopeptidase